MSERVEVAVIDPDAYAIHQIARGIVRALIKARRRVDVAVAANGNIVFYAVVPLPRKVKRVIAGKSK